MTPNECKKSTFGYLSLLACTLFALPLIGVRISSRKQAAARLLLDNVTALLSVDGTDSLNSILSTDAAALVGF